VLDRDRLRNKLREFCDADYSAFRGFPPTKPAARNEWASAFDDYLGVAEEDIPLPPSNAHPSMLMTGVKAAFEGDLGLDDSISAAASAADFAGAWKTSIEAITAGGVATDTAGTTYAFLAFTNTTGQHATLLSTLTSLFESPTISTVQRLTDIAAAFHAATDGLMFGTTKTVPGTPPVVTPNFPVGLR
jgi:hypothetical protein